MSRKAAKKKVEQSLQNVNRRLKEIDKINNKIKDPVVKQQVKKAEGTLTKVNKNFVSWVNNGAAGAVKGSLILGGLGLLITILSSIDKRLNDRRLENLNALQEQHARNRNQRWHERMNAIYGPEPQPPRNNRPNIFGEDGDEFRNMLNPQRRQNLRQQAQAEMNATNERLRREMAERQAAREHANQAATDIGRAQEGIRELDFEERQSGPSNSPGEQGARFSGLDLDSGYRIKCRKTSKNKLVTHDSMPWSRPVRHVDDLMIKEKAKALSDKLNKAIKRLEKYRSENPKIGALLNALFDLTTRLSALGALFTIGDAANDVYYKRLIKAQRKALTEIDDLERNDARLAAQPTGLQVTLKFLRGILFIIGSFISGVFTYGLRQKVR